MPKELPPNPLTKSDQPFVLAKGELSKKFRILKLDEVEKLGLVKKAKPEKRRENKEGEVSLGQAQEIMGADFLGAEAVEKTFGFMPEDVPPIPFSASELERARELNQFLELRIDKTADGQPLNMEKMYKLLQPEFTAGNNGRILNSHGKADSWYKSESFLKDTPRASWVLVSKDVIPDSLSKNFLQQTEVITNYLKNEVFKGQELPDVYKEAVEEFEAKKAGIAAILTSNWQEAAKQLSELKINQLTRQLPVETMYDFVMYFKNNKKRLLEGKYTWTYRRASAGGLVLVGYFASGGASVGLWTPADVGGIRGVVFSRSL